MPQSTEHTFAYATPIELEPGVLRLTLPLPAGPKHVHCYLVRDEDGWMLVDTGIGLPEERWAEIAAELDAPVVRIFITHMHPDHVGCSAPAAAATGAPVLQGRLDYEQCERVWGGEEWPPQIAEWYARHGAPEAFVQELVASGHVFADFVRFARDPQPVEPGDEIAGWRVVATPGHADGHLCLLRDDGVLLAGDHLLTPITPAIGLYPDGSPDPLGDYFASLALVEELAPRVAYSGHGETVRAPAERAREIAAHHEQRLDEVETHLAGGPRTGFDLSFELFGRALDPIQRRFAVAETLSHLERLVLLGRAQRHESDRRVSYTGV